MIPKLNPFNLISLTVFLLMLIGQVFAFDYFYDGFEDDNYSNNDNINPDKWKKIKEFGDYSFQAVSSPVREGSKAIRFEYKYGNEDDPGSTTYFMTHVQIEEKDGNGNLRCAPIGDAAEECWYGWSIYFPADFPGDNESVRGLFAQFHSYDGDLGDVARSPNLAFLFSSPDNLISVRTLWHDAVTQGSNFFNDITHTTFEHVSGGWNDFVVRVKWTWTSNGYLQIWHNGEMIVNYTGPTSYNDSKGPYFCMGIYLNHSENTNQNQSDYIIYGDAYRTGNSYGEVNPNRDITPILNLLLLD